ncbi:4-phosphopantoate-beta-alanine ligase [Methanobacterium sp. MB1]|jgi:4-phosphopantoate--beta-alanine ligase|uniref:4-phosphopantoate--beta-alanine ligase n=1 Tax=Methanobacterium sp. TaxID=2164 RepID=UPI0003C9D7FF|nr:4-phosphopantoate--beta-alanine ligase [uncultured Methanobacterium sp.]CDG65278.1 4-phosphopantoate-beta-alanine ligase [Methanobacterium sp. MB1]
MHDMPPNHPRYQSLLLRDKMANAYKEGILADTALIAHGRGEAFDYILGEKTNVAALNAIKAASAALLLAKNPVLSINGNTSVLAAEDIVKLAQILPAKVEINLFYRTPQRVMKVEEVLRKAGATEILGKEGDDYLPLEGLEGPRSRAHPEGVYKADVVLVPLEDGDRAEALVALGKTVITIDLNPLSRTAQTSSITIVDNIVRAIPLIIEEINKLKGCPVDELESIVREFDNKRNIASSLQLIVQYLEREGK